MDISSSQSFSTRKVLTNEERRIVYETLLKKSKNGKLERGSYDIVADLLSVNVRTVRRVWKQSQTFIENGLSVNVSNKLAACVGRKRVEVDVSKITEIPLRQRSNIRSLAKAANMSKSTIHRRITEGAIRSHSNALKPLLTDENKKARLRFCLSMLNNHHTNPSFSSMHNYMHIDEKWFYMTKDTKKFYLAANEPEPERACKSKRFISKIMFLAAVARPRIDALDNVQFYGKIGIFPFIFKEPAKRNSKNRVAGTLETKPILSITKDVTRACLIENVLPAIRSKWPRAAGTMETIYIQQDNAKPHISSNDLEFTEAASRDGFDIRLLFQPPNSPDFNVLDLGFFRAIQSLQHQEAPNTIDELVQAVKKSFEDLSVENLNYVFLTMQMCMIESMKLGGGINYRLQHMGKKRLERIGQLPQQLGCERELVENVTNYLRDT